ncbi:MAG: hypothetical protein ACLUFT_11005 [Gemmiger formicilis]|uniref:hypothetical protein n=1 Tax=Gemmiger formicilis TaxID=745368 RepID=UPI003995FDB3
MRKTWVNRQSEHPARRRLTPQATTMSDVACAEGVIMEDGDAFDAETMNDLESAWPRVLTLDPADLGVNVCAGVRLRQVGHGVRTDRLGRGGALQNPCRVNSGDTWSVNGKAVPAYWVRTPWTATHRGRALGAVHL